jgi:hypothetical protein
MQMFEPVTTATIPRLGRYGRRRSVLLLRPLLRGRQRGNIIVDIDCIYLYVIYPGYTADQSQGMMLQYRYLFAAAEPLAHYSGLDFNHTTIAVDRPLATPPSPLSRKLCLVAAGLGTAYFCLTHT